jgi:hypothetical protein
VGVGLVGAIPLTARLLRGAAGTGGERLLDVLLRSTQLALVAMALTGVLLDLSVAGAFHRTAWLRISIVVFVAIGFSVGRARATLRKARASGQVQDEALARVERWGLVMCVGVALITLLMQTKPLS